MQIRIAKYRWDYHWDRDMVVLGTMLSVFVLGCLRMVFF